MLKMFRATFGKRPHTSLKAHMLLVLCHSMQCNPKDNGLQTHRDNSLCRNLFYHQTGS